MPLNVGCAKALRMVQPCARRPATALRRGCVATSSTNSGSRRPQTALHRRSAWSRRCVAQHATSSASTTTAACGRASRRPRLLFGREQFQDNAETPLTAAAAALANTTRTRPRHLCAGFAALRQADHVLENGLPTPTMTSDRAWLLAHLLSLHRAMRGAIDGYCWTLVDNFEWDEGWNLRFGLFESLTRTQQRRQRPSVARSIARSPSRMSSPPPLASKLRPHALA